MATSAPCPETYKECDPPANDFCNNNGICCSQGSGDRICRCFQGFDPRDNCASRIDYIDYDASREKLKHTVSIATFSAIIGIAVIALFVILVALQVKYYRQRKRRQYLREHEMKTVLTPDAAEKDPKNRLSHQPGYSWRESIRGQRKPSYRMQRMLSRSVPEDLCKLVAYSECCSSQETNLGVAVKSTVVAAAGTAAVGQTHSRAGAGVGTAAAATEPEGTGAGLSSNTDVQMCRNSEEPELDSSTALRSVKVESQTTEDTVK